MTEKKQTMSLSGEWELCYTQIGTGRLEKIDTLFAERTISCPVPGDVHMALTSAGIIKEPLLDQNSLNCRWIEEQEFWYRKRFVLSEDFIQDKTKLVFEGLDTTADIWLNGMYIGSNSNAFVEKVIDVSSCVEKGENVLVVRIDDGHHAVKDRPVDLMKYSWNAEQPYRAWMRKPQFVYGWDWTIWLPSCGIWKDVSIHSCRKACIEDVNIKTRFDENLITDAQQIDLDITVEIDFFKSEICTIWCEVFEDDRFSSGKSVAFNSCGISADNAGKGLAVLCLALDDPKLWWPNGYGSPYLYTVEVRLADECGNILHTVRQRHGVRTVQIREDALDEHSSEFTFTINGEKIFCKGANHVPADCLPGRITADKTRALLSMAAEGNMNMIRVWGGGIYESDCFMDTCDELGLMVWHDFMFACAFYPDNVPEFYEEIRHEATLAIRRLRRHASLVGWSGNNEIQEMYRSVKKRHPEQIWYGKRLYDELLPILVQELCPDRIYRPSSPYSGNKADDYDHGDQHTWHFTHRPDWEHYLDLWRFTDMDYKFLSEFGIIGAMSLESAKKCIRENALNPNSAEWRHHTNSNTDHKLLDILIHQYFGEGAVRDLQDYILKSQVLQAEIMRHIYDELRSRKFRCSGALLWTLSDSYGIHNWSVIDYYLDKRPVYYYLKRAMAPINISFRGYAVQNFNGMTNYQAHYLTEPTPIELYAANDSREKQQIVLTYRIMTFDGRVLWEETLTDAIAANGIKKFGEADISKIRFDPNETILYAEARKNGEIVNENHYFFAPFGKLRLRQAKVKYEIKRISEDEKELTLTADTFVWMLHMKNMEDVIYSDNDFILLPGQVRTVRLIGSADGVPEFCCLNPDIMVCEGNLKDELQV